MSDESNILATDAATVTDVTAKASNSVTTDITVSKDGYTLLGVVGYIFSNASSDGANSSMVSVYCIYVRNNTTVRVVWKNTATSDAKVNIQVKTLWVKS